MDKITARAPTYAAPRNHELEMLDILESMVEWDRAMMIPTAYVILMKKIDSLKDKILKDSK